MPRQGRLLEILVKHLQEFLGPEGIEVQSPEEFFRNGEKIGEIDVTLRGQFGSSRIFVGIECRDRPSGPPQGRDWIREVLGKKMDLHVDKMIAVSSTGFTSQAIHLADESDIELLHVQNLDELDLHDWFKTFDFTWQEDFFIPIGDANIETLPRDLRGLLPFEANTPIFRVAGNDHTVSLADLVDARVDSLFAAMLVTDGVTEINTVLQIEGQIELQYGEAKYKVTRITIPLQLSRQIHHARALLNVCKRLSDNEVIAMMGYCRIETPAKNFSALVLAKNSKTDPSMMDLRVSFLTEDHQPFQLPAGTRMSLYGLQEG